MLGLKIRRSLIAVFVATSLILPMSEFAYAETMSSTNYKIQTDVMSQGGGNASSASFKANDSVGDLATGQDLTSANYRACSGFECFGSAPYITFSVKSGISAPGTDGIPVALGTLTTGAVATSNGSTINSIFITAESNAGSGAIVTVTDVNNGLKRSSTADIVGSSTASLVAGTPGYGVCVFSSTQGGTSPTTFNAVSPYASTCNKTTGHFVGLVSTSPNSILASTGQLVAGQAEILVKAAIGGTTAAGSDYADTLTFIETGTY